MTALDITLTPAQWEHYDRHGWTLTEAPTRTMGLHIEPVPATVPCPECGGTGQARIGDLMTYLPPCRRCSGSGVVPRVVGIIPPEWCGDSGPFPAERVGIATVTPVPVVDDIDDSPEEAAVLDVSTVLGVCWFWPEGAVNNGEESDVTALFATPPAPGGTVWRLDKENDHE